MSAPSLSKEELLALDGKGLEAILTQISAQLLTHGWMLATAESCTGGSADKPVGTVWFGWSTDGVVTTEMRRFAGDRAAVRQATLAHALRGVVQRMAPA